MTLRSKRGLIDSAMALRNWVARNLYSSSLSVSRTLLIKRDAPKPPGDAPTLDQLVCYFLRQHDIDIKPASFKQGGKAATVVIASTGNPFLISQYGILTGQKAAVAVQEWTSWKQWAMAHDDWKFFLSEEKRMWNENVKTIDADYKSFLGWLDSDEGRLQIEQEASQISKREANLLLMVAGGLVILAGVFVWTNFSAYQPQKMLTSQELGKNKSNSGVDTGAAESRTVPSEKVSQVYDIPLQCKQLVGDIMGRDPGSMSTDYRSEAGELVGISYVRQDDGKTFKYECGVEDSNLVWRGVDIDGPGSGPGRWRYEDQRPLK